MKKAILISCFDWYEARLKPIKEILENEYNVSILTSDFEHISKNRIKNRIDACEYIHVPSYKKNVSIKRIFSHIVFGKKVGKRINKICPDLIYLLLPPNNIARYCLDYKKKHPEVKYIVDIIDMWPESMPIHRLENTIPYKYWTNFRNQSIQQADVVMTECELYQEKLLKDIPRDYKVLYLYKNENDKLQRYVFDYIEKGCIKHRDYVKLGYLGSINNIIDIDGIEKIVALLSKKKRVVIEVIGIGESCDELITKLKNTGADVHYHGAIFEEIKKAEILMQCDYGINMMKKEVSVGLTIKSIDYFSYGLPIINNIQNDTWNFVEKYNLGVNVGDNLEDVLEKIINNEEYSKQNVLKFYFDHFTETSYKIKLLENLNSVV